MAEGGQNLNSKDDDPHQIPMRSEFNTESSTNADEIDTYEVAGGKLSLHGFAYQKKLLMLFALRSVKKGLKFKLATEMKKADKVDDVILMSPKVDGPGNLCRFLQAKHRSINVDNMKKISAEDLLKQPKGQFSIPMYFQSYLKIVREFLAEGDEIKDIIICTNGGLEVGSLCKGFTLTYDIFKVIDEDDFIFGKTLRKLKEEFPGRRAIVSLLMNCFSKFPDELAKSVSLGKTYNHSLPVNSKDKDKEIERLYEMVFLEEVVSLKSKRFREDFAIGVNLTGIGKHFRSSLLLEWERLDKKDCFEDWLRNKVVDVNGITEDHGLNVKLVAESVRKNFTKKVIEIQDKKSLLYKNMEVLKLMDVFEVTGGGLRFSKSFLNSDGLCERAENLRKELLNNLSYFKIELNSLGGMKFDLKENMMQTNYLKIGEFNPEKYVMEFLSVMVFAIDQPNEEELGITIKDELKSVLIGSTVDTAYGKLYTWIDEWLSSPKGKFLTEDDFKTFFDDLKEEVFFDLRDPVYNFTGRLTELNKLHEVLLQSEGRAAIISQTATISGLGGIGKSELVRMYAKKHKKEFNNIIWIDCETQNTTESSFRRLAYDRLSISRKNSNGEEKKIESIVEDVYQRLKGKKNLFIFDNAEQLRNVGTESNGIQKYISPSSDESCNYYIITSRNRKWGTMKVVDLDNFTDEEALQFFRDTLCDLEEDSDSEKIGKLADALGNFPLAMQQATAYIKETSDEFKIFSKQYSVSDYLEDFMKKSKELLDYEFPSDSDDKYTRTTYTTWKLAIEAIYHKEHGSLSANILNLISYLQPDHIDSSLFIRILHSEDKHSIGKALLLLQQYCLISLQDNIIRIHRLLQLVIRIYLKDKELEKETLISILQLWECLHLDHLISVWNSVHHYEELVRENTCLPQHIIVKLCISYQPEIALSLGRNLELTYRNMFGYYHLNTTNLRRLIAEAFAYKGDWKECLDLLQSTYEEQREFLGDLHSSTLFTQRDLATVSNLLSDSIDNVNIFQDVYDKSNIVLGENSVFALGVKKDCALSLYNKLNFNEAFEMFQEVVEQCNKIYSSDSGEIVALAELMMAKIKLQLNVDFNLNYELFERRAVQILGRIDKVFLWVYLKATDITESTLFNGFIINTYRRFFEIYKKQYGEDDFDLIEWRLRYASCLLDLSYIDESYSELVDIYNKQKCFSSEKHCNMSYTRYLIAKAISKKGNHREALRIYKEVLDLADKKHDKIFLQSEIEISEEHCHLGQYDRALEIMERINSSRISNQFSRKRLTIKILSHYGTVLRLAGQYEKAAEKYSEVMNMQDDSLGSRSISTLKSGALYSVSLYESGNGKKSREVLKEILRQINEMDIKADMLEVISLNELVADALCKLDMNEEEKSFRLRSLETLEKIFGKQKPVTLLTMSKLAIVECKLGNDQNARKLLQDIELNLPKLQNPEDFLEVELMVVEILSRLKDFKECLKRLEQIQNIQCKKKILEENKLTNSMLNVSITMSENGKLNDSLKLLSDIRKRRCSFNGSNHRATLKATREIVKVLLQKNDFKNALKECKKLLYIQRNTYGEEDIDTIRTKCVHALYLAKKKQCLEALEILNQCHKLMSDKLGEDDVEVLNVEYCIGCTLCNIGELEHGKNCLFNVYKKQKTLLGENNKETISTKSFLEQVFRSEENKRKK